MYCKISPNHSGDYFLANGSQSCDDSCAAVGMSCDLDKVEGCGCLDFLISFPPPLALNIEHLH